MKPRKYKTPGEKAYHDVVASLPCVLCGLLGQRQTTPTTVHHDTQSAGMAQRSGHYLAAALCRDCHQGPLGVHGDKTLLRIAKVSELDLINETIGQAFAAMREVLHG